MYPPCLRGSRYAFGLGGGWGSGLALGVVVTRTEHVEQKMPCNVSTSLRERTFFNPCVVWCCVVLLCAYVCVSF